MSTIIHGQRKRSSRRTKEYMTWDRIIQRCHNPNCKLYPRYGAKGIKVCDRWRKSFSAFFEDMGNAPSQSHSIDRFPNKFGDYEPDNCRWATFKEQQRNKSTNRQITAFGVTQLLCEWAEQSGLTSRKICNRINNGWTNEMAVSFKGY